MMRFTSHSAKSDRTVIYETAVPRESMSLPGVCYKLVRMSFGRRTELLRQIRELATRLPFLEASAEFREQVEANLLAQEIDLVYLRWGIQSVHNLVIDGEPATVESLIQSGPEELCRELVEAVKGECGLSGEERKN